MSPDEHDGDGQPRRAGPSQKALAWVVEAAGGGTVASVRRLRGATSSVVHEVVVRRRRAREGLVLRRYVHPAWVAGGPMMVEQEAAALRAARTAPCRSPQLVAVDALGEQTGAPALLMTRLPGRPRVSPAPSWLEELAATHRAMADWTDAGASLPPYASWMDARAEPPAWSMHPAAWERAIELVVGRVPDHRPPQPIHRDLHPGNITFLRGRAHGVVDWVNACRGPIESDLAQCRVNLVVLAGLGAADRFLQHTGEIGGSDPAWHPAWDLVVAVGLLPDPTPLIALNELGANVSPSVARRRLDQLVARAIAALR